MLDAGGGGGYGGTNWAGMSVPDMWLAVGNQETTSHWELLTGWRKSYELTMQHMAAVKNYRENLAAAWPPEKSPAAAAYVAQLDMLIANLQHTYDAAVANYTAFSGATLALNSARRDLEKVVNEYVANEGKLAGYEEEKANRPVASGKAMVPPLRSPVAEGRQAELERQARSIMYGLSSEIVQARAQVAHPPKYTPGRQRGETEREGEGATISPPPIPPVTPFDPTSGGTLAAGASSSSHPTVQPVAAVSGPSTNLPGLVLGGANQPAGTPGPQPSLVAPTTASPPISGPTPVTPLAPSLSPPMRGLPSASGGPGSPGQSMARPTGAPMSPLRAIPPGGVIGAVPGALGPTGGTPRSPSHVNPVGGMIGPNQPPNSSNGARATTTNRGSSAPMHPAGQMPNRLGEQEEDASARHRWDPDNPWQTDEGVAPILKPEPSRHFDPGPAIGLH